MRATLSLLAALGLLAGCATQPPPPQAVAAAPPSVSYQVYGNDVAQANVQADGYCQQYGMYANLQSVQPNGPQSVATYVCGGSRVSSAAPSYGAPYGAPPPPYAAAAPIRCADPLHQGLPGGTDYRGPPVPGCP
ncbi:MAG TPA: hypothetical protein VHT04_05785 [Stellaceae bacterium]|jgi:hypothetical protein|nr:hypothetical protein [Stellaceae bacterium]